MTYKQCDIVLAQTGDEEAFERLVTAHYGIIWQAYRNLNRRISNDEWLQDCRIVMLNCLVRLRGQEVKFFSGDFKRACTNRVASYFSRDVPRMARQGQELIDNFGDVVDQQGPRMQQHLEVEHALLLREFMRCLVERDQVIMIMKIEGYSNNEIAKQLGVCRATVQGNWQKIKCLLRVIEINRDK